MKRILYYVDLLEYAGIQSLLYEICKNFDKTKYVISIMTLDSRMNNKDLVSKFNDLGIKIYTIDNVFLKSPIDYINYKKQLKNFFSCNYFDIIHIHSGPKNYIVAKIASEYKIGKIIYHSHNTNYQTKNFISKIIGNFLKSKVSKYSTHYVACSREAGKWLFKKSIQKKVIIIHNPISINNFIYDFNGANRIKREFDIDSDLVILSVGRFVKQKNHIYILKIFKEILFKKPKSILFLVGDGALKNKIYKISKKWNISNNVIFTGLRKDVQDFMSCSNVLLMPSFNEGFPVVSVEAQVNGLPCVFSKNITKEAKIIDDSMYLSLKKTPRYWANTIINKYVNYMHESYSTDIDEYSFDTFFEKIREIYK